MKILWTEQVVASGWTWAFYGGAGNELFGVPYVLSTQQQAQDDCVSTIQEFVMALGLRWTVKQDKALAAMMETKP